MNPNGQKLHRLMESYILRSRDDLTVDGGESALQSFEILIPIWEIVAVSGETRQRGREDEATGGLVSPEEVMERWRSDEKYSREPTLVLRALKLDSSKLTRGRGRAGQRTSGGALGSPEW
ncbi:hypothetical protein GQ457_07G017290 [Hibiscus cannabinus]